MMIPTIHLNGTSKAALTAALETAVNAIRVAESSMTATEPNGLDYHPQGDGAFVAARLEHWSRRDRLMNVRCELQVIWDAIEGMPR